MNEIIFQTDGAVDVITTAVSNLQGELMGVAAIGLTVGVAIFALKRGWGLVKGFTKG